MGRTPLDLAKMTANHVRKDSVQMAKFEIGQQMVVGRGMIIDKGFTDTIELSGSFHFESQSYKSERETTDREMIDLLTSVGGTTGDMMSQEDKFLASLMESKMKPLTTDPDQGDTATPLDRIDSDCGSDSYCKCYKDLDSRIAERLKDASYSPTPQEALELVRDLRRKELIRRKHGSRILCLDGGGIRGLVTLCILQEIERRMKMSITEIFDWIVGTSTGGIIALGLCYGEYMSLVSTVVCSVLVLNNVVCVCRSHRNWKVSTTTERSILGEKERRLQY